MKSSKRIFTILILFVSILIFSMLTATAVTLSEQKTLNTEDGIHIETKYKQVSKNKITFDANGGKIGTKTKVTKNINKGAKIKTFPANPKRTGYTFKGWYTKKSGGSKITVNTKPKKSVTVYGQWKKKVNSRVLTAEEKKMVGNWVSHYSAYLFNNNGTFHQTIISNNAYYMEYQAHGNYHVKNGRIYLTNTVEATHYNPGISFLKHEWSKREDESHEYKWSVEESNCLVITSVLGNHISYKKR